MFGVGDTEGGMRMEITECICFTDGICSISKNDCIGENNCTFVWNCSKCDSENPQYTDYCYFCGGRKKEEE